MRKDGSGVKSERSRGYNYGGSFAGRIFVQDGGESIRFFDSSEKGSKG